jgi:hypothetical protein
MMDQLGSDKTYNHYPVGWTHAMDTPFQWTKQVASHFGGTRNGMAVSWPKRIKAQGEIRSQFQHVTDIGAEATTDPRQFARRAAAARPAPFYLPIDSKLRGCDLVALRVDDVAPNG